MQASPQATPKWPGNRFGFVPALPGALPSTTFSLGTGPRAWWMGRRDNPVSPTAPQQPSPGVQYPTHRWSVNRFATAFDSSNSQLSGRDEAQQVLVQLAL